MIESKLKQAIMKNITRSTRMMFQYFTLLFSYIYSFVKPWNHGFVGLKIMLILYILIVFLSDATTVVQRDYKSDSSLDISSLNSISPRSTSDICEDGFSDLKELSFMKSGNKLSLINSIVLLTT